MSRRLFLLPVALVFAGCDSAVSFRLPPMDGPRLTKLDLVSVEPAPVLDRGAEGEWDSVDVLNPSVVRAADGAYWNFYSGFDGKTWHTGLAKSSGKDDRWAKVGRVLSPEGGGWEGDYIAANGSAILVDGEFLYWYQAGRVGQGTGPKIGLARSRDGKSFRKESAPVLGPGPYLSWDERRVADPYDLRLG